MKSPIFDLLEVNSDDIGNMVAYALYKRHKREWAHGIREETGDDPTPAQDIEFARALSTDSSLERLRQDANGMLVAFANQVVEDERPYIEEGAVPKRVETAVSSFEKSNAWWRQLLVSLVTSVVTIAVLVLFTLSAGVFGIDVVDESALIKTPSEQPVAPAASE